MKSKKYTTMNLFIGLILFLSCFICLTKQTMESESVRDFAKRQLKPQNVVAEMQVVCHSDAILLKMNTNTPFNGMVYARGEPHSSNCVSEFNSATNMTFRLPLKACGTLFSEVDDGIEYFNTVVVQPHMRLMTNQGKGYHIRCKYQTRERTIANTQFNVSASFNMQDAPKATTPLLATASMPSCTMKIFRKGRSDIAESVKIGDKLVMVIEIDRQDMYGMRVSNCVVRDGLNVADQLLIDNVGCPLDETIMPSFEYSNNYTRAAVSFPAHKFPHTSSVYYQCNISLCINNGNCIVPECNKQQSQSTNQANQAQSGAASSSTSSPSGGARRKRHSSHPTSLDSSTNGKLIKSTKDGDYIDRIDDMSFDVYSGLMVNDVDEDDQIPSGSDEFTAATGNIRHSTIRNGSFGFLDVLGSIGQQSMTFFLIACVTMIILIALLCQLGLVGRSIEQQVPSSSTVQLTNSRRHDNHASQELAKNRSQLVNFNI